MDLTVNDITEQVVRRVNELSSVETDLLRKVLDKIENRYNASYCIRCGSVEQPLELKSIECNKCKKAWCEKCKHSNKVYEYDMYISKNLTPCHESYHDELVEEKYPYPFTIKLLEMYFKTTDINTILPKISSMSVGFQYVYRHQNIESDISFDYINEEDDPRREEDDDYLILEECRALISRYVDARNSIEITDGYIFKMFDPKLIQLFEKYNITIQYAEFFGYGHTQRMDWTKKYFGNTSIIIHQCSDS